MEEPDGKQTHGMNREPTNFKLSKGGLLDAGGLMRGREGGFMDGGAYSIFQVNYFNRGGSYFNFSLNWVGLIRRGPY